MDRKEEAEIVDDIKKENIKRKQRNRMDQGNSRRGNGCVWDLPMAENRVDVTGGELKLLLLYARNDS